METEDASASTSAASAPAPATRGGRGRGARGGARKSTGGAGRGGKKRNAELDALKDSLSVEPTSNKRPRRGAAPVSMPEVDEDGTPEGGAGTLPALTVASSTTVPTKKRIIESSEDEGEQAEAGKVGESAEEAAAKTGGLKVKLKKPISQLEDVQAPETQAEDATKADAMLEEQSQEASIPLTSALAAEAPAASAQEPTTQSSSVSQEQPAQLSREPSPPSTLATHVIDTAEDSDTGSTSANKKKVPTKGTSSVRKAGSSVPTPSISQQILPYGHSPLPSTSAGALKKLKQPIKPPGLAKPKPKPAPAAPLTNDNIFDSLFSGIVATTDHEKQLKRDREEKAIAVAKQKEREAQAKKATLSLARVAAAGGAGAESGNEGSDTSGPPKKQKQPTKAALPSFGKQPGSKASSDFSNMSKLQQRYGGHEHTRRQEIATARAEAKRKREEVASQGGFDLLAQGLEMSSFETPFLKDWNGHQALVFGGQGRMFPFYLGGPPKEEDVGQDDEEEGQMSSYRATSMQHPWTFGAAFSFKGSKPAHTPPARPVWD